MTHVFGDIKTFAIEALLQESITIIPMKRGVYRPLLGRMWFWAKGSPIGYPDQTMVLGASSGNLAAFAHRGPRPMDDAFLGKTADQVLDIIDNALYQPKDDNTEVDNGRYYKYVLSQNIGEAFDGYFVVLVERDEQEWLIWKEYSRPEVFECWLEMGQIERVIEEFVSWIKAEYEKPIPFPGC